MKQCQHSSAPFLVSLILVVSWQGALAASMPQTNPVESYRLAWTESLPWGKVVSIADFPGSNWNARLAAAQEAVAAKGGGVVYFPAGTYEFTESIALKNRVILRGAEPATADARQESYAPPTKFEFPRFVPKLEGEGTPHDSAFKMIYLEDPATGSDCGLVNLAINRGHIYFGSATNHLCGHNRLVFGCTLRNAADIDRNIPNLKEGQHPWQRFPKWHQAAMGVYATENILIANNRLPESGEDNFLMKDYLLKDRKGKMAAYEDGVLFDYDFRPGIIANQHCVGGGGGAMPVGTPEIYPWGFTKGIVVRDNYIFCTGRTAIAFCGEGVVCSYNVIRFKKGVVRPSHTGLHLSTGSATSDNRAVEMRGWRWTVEGNDYEVYRSLCADKKFYINDGEGLMHEGHCNSAVIDSKVVRNKGNAYISIFHTGGIENLLVEGNDIQPDLKVASSIGAIYVVADRNKTPFPCKNVRIINNVTGGTGIQLTGAPGENNLVSGNKSVTEKGKIVNRAAARVENNTGYVETTTDPKAKK